MKRESMRHLGRRSFLKRALATAPLLLVGPSLLPPGRTQAHGIARSTTTDAYLLPSIPGVRAVAILTVGDSVDGYRMVGIPDGLGAFPSDRHHFTLLMNHELPATSGMVRAHGSKGAFVSRWTIDRTTLEVVKGEDFTASPESVFLWDPATEQYVAGTTVWERHCSADLARPGAFFHHGKGTTERLYLNGAEVSHGRAWARIATGRHAGEAWQLPRFGHMAYENAVASPYRQRKRVVTFRSTRRAPIPSSSKAASSSRCSSIRISPRPGTSAATGRRTTTTISTTTRFSSAESTSRRAPAGAARWRRAVRARARRPAC